jgi:hypothetical protein
LESPVCGALFTGRGGALICERCVGAAAARLPRAGDVRLVTAHGWLDEPDSVENLAAAYQPTGPLPDDEAEARQQIEYVFANPSERSADGTGLVNVERGEDLGPYQDQVRARVAAFLPRSGLVIDHIKFLNTSEAVVWTTSLLDGHPVAGLRHTQGRAVFVDGRWKISRATMCALFARAGVICPADPD